LIFQILQIRNYEISINGKRQKKKRENRTKTRKNSHFMNIYLFLFFVFAYFDSCFELVGGSVVVFEAVGGAFAAPPLSRVAALLVSMSLCRSEKEERDKQTEYRRTIIYFFTVEE
jgi:hypothetical protein